MKYHRRFSIGTTFDNASGVKEFFFFPSLSISLFGEHDLYVLFEFTCFYISFNKEINGKIK